MCNVNYSSIYNLWSILEKKEVLYVSLSKEIREGKGDKIPSCFDLSFIIFVVNSTRFTTMSSIMHPTMMDLSIITSWSLPEGSRWLLTKPSQYLAYI